MASRIDIGLLRMWECPICLNPVSDHRELPCKHLFCLTCLERVVKYDSISCPVCRDVCPLSGKTVHDLPNNLVLAGFLDHMCEKCKVKSRVVNCSHCTLWLCETCHEKCQDDAQEMLESLRASTEQLLSTEQMTLNDIHKDITRVQRQVIELSGDIDNIADDAVKRLRVRQLELKDKLRKEAQTAARRLETAHEYISANSDVLKAFIDTYRRRLGSKETYADIANINQEWTETYSAIVNETLSPLHHTHFEYIVDRAKSVGVADVCGQVNVKVKCDRTDGFPSSKQQSTASRPSDFPQTVIMREATIEDKDGNEHTTSLSNPMWQREVMHETLGGDEEMPKHHNDNSANNTGSYAIEPCSLKTDTTTETCNDLVNEPIAESKTDEIPKTESNIEEDGQSTGDEAAGDQIADTSENGEQFRNPKICKDLLARKYSGKPNIYIGSHGKKQFNHPSFVTISPYNGDIIVSDTKNNRIVILDKRNTYKSEFGDQDLILDENFLSGGVVVMHDGRIVVSDSDDTLAFFDSKGSHIRSYGCSGKDFGQFKSLRGLGSCDGHNIYVCEEQNRRVHIIQNRGSTCISARLLGVHHKMGDWRPSGVSFFPNGDPVIADRRGKLIIFRNGGKSHKSMDMGGLLKDPRDVAVDVQGNIVVTDAGTHKVHVIRPTGEILHTFGGQGTAAGKFKFPTGVACTGDGRLIVVDQGNHRIQFFEWK